MGVIPPPKNHHGDIHLEDDGCINFRENPPKFLQMEKKKNSGTHPVDEVDPPHGADFRGVIDEADVPLGGSVQLSDLDVPEAIQELRPNVRPDPVADSDPNFVILFIVFLQAKEKKTSKTETRQNFSIWLT